MILPRPLHTALSTLLMISALAIATPAPAQNTQPATDEEIETQLGRWNFKLDLMDDELEKQNIDEILLAALRNQAERMKVDMIRVRDRASSRLKGVRKLLKSLGPPPKDSQTPEEASAAQRRIELLDKVAKFESQAKRTELTYARAEQILQGISKKLLDKLAVELLARGPSPLSWPVIFSAGPHLVSVLRQLFEAPLEVWAPALPQGDVSYKPGGPLLALLVAIALAWPSRRWLLTRYVRDRLVETPSFARKTVTAIMVGIARGVLPAMASATPLLVLITMEQQRGIAGDMLVAALSGITFVLLVSGLARAILAPFSITGWRITPLTHNSSRRLYRRIVALSWAAAAFVLIEYPARLHLQIPPDLLIFYDFVSDTIIALFILSLLPARMWRDRAHVPGESKDDGSGPPIRLGTLLRVIVGAIAIAIPVTSLLGYANLSNFLTANLFLSGIVLGLTFIIHSLVRDLTALALARTITDTPVDGSGAAPDHGILHFWLVVAFDMVLAVVAGMVLLTLWGVAWAELKDWLQALAKGVQVGSFTFSFTDFLAAILVFAVVMVTTRALQHLLENSIFPKTRLDIGVRNSLKAATGYTGLVIAIMLTISTLGLDLSNLAIVAGALSVGIGFGLQNVVNNFVSGLVLLIERPVKVGDWIVVGAHEGYVKRINVRATEIQTFQRSSVIIPNAELISTALVNWTHKDTLARVSVPVGVAYGSDTALVQELLINCAKEHSRINSWPQPFVLFQDFGESSLDFELRFFIAQADEVFRVASDIRFAIDNAFREHGVEIPFPQRDIHIRSKTAQENGAEKKYTGTDADDADPPDKPN